LEEVMMSDEALKGVVKVDPSVYRLSAVKKAAYRLSGRGDFAISSDGEDQIKVAICVRNAMDDVDDLAREFRRQLLDQDLREEIAEQTAPISHLLLAQAFSATSLIDHHSDTDDFRSDPAGISQPDRFQSDATTTPPSQGATDGCQRSPCQY
jgi:His-Xaa-Ser system protein HxsD